MPLWGKTENDRDRPTFIATKNNVNTDFIDNVEADNAALNNQGIKTPGWNHVETYTTNNGTVTRHKIEPIVALKSTSPLVSIGAEGWNGTFYKSPPEFSFGDAGLTFSVRRKGFNGEAVPVEFNENVNITTRVREPYPDQDDLTINNVAFSDFVYQNEVVYKSNVENLSNKSYPLPIAAWATPEWTRADSDSFKVRLAVAHAHARNRRPVAAVEFIASDGTNTFTVNVNTMTNVLFTSSNLAIPVYEGLIDLSSLNEGEVTINAKIYPWVGEEFDIAIDASATKTINLCPLSILNNRAGGAVSYAFVNLNSGNDISAEIGSTATLAESSPYATFAAAVTAARTYNNTNFNRDNAGGTVITLNDGNHDWVSFRNIANGTSNNIPIYIEGESRSGTIVRGPSTQTQSSICFRSFFSNFTFQPTTATTITFDFGAITEEGVTVFDRISFDGNSIAPYDGVVFRTGRTIFHDCSENVNTGIGNVLGGSTAAKLIRFIGSDFKSVENHYGALASRVPEYNTFEPQGIEPPSIGVLISHCFMTSNTTIIETNHEINSRGFGLIGNVIERITSSLDPCVNIGTGTNTVENLVMMGNTMVGSRTNLLYNNTGNVRIDKSGVYRANIAERLNIIGDINAEESDLTGNWAFRYQTGNSLNATISGPGTVQSSTEIYGPVSWLGEIPGPGDISGTTADRLETEFDNDQSLTNSAVALGSGIYSPDSSISEIPRYGDLKSIPYSHSNLNNALTITSFIGAQ